jgi:doubled CXXCH motif protein
MKYVGRKWLAIVLGVAVLGGGALVAAPFGGRQQQEKFPHARHANLFPLCTACHAGVTEAGQPIFPNPASCASCHDGVVKQRVSWQPPAGPRGSNLRFTHGAHHRAVTARDPADSVLVRSCSNCHTREGEPRMAVRHSSSRRCLACHGLTAPHVDNPPAACAKCHVPLTEAPGLTALEIADFPKPSSHDAPDFRLGGHGRLAKVTQGGRVGVAASCATCHARNLCISCHVNAAESPVISALKLDDRSPVFALTQPVPASHSRRDFISTHGRDAERGTASCATCHTRESCATCHSGTAPRAVASLPAAGPNRAAGAQLMRTPPPSHTRDFREKHAPEAGARPRTCQTCHVRSMCLTCHRPDVGPQARYHPESFITRHPSAAYSRSASCSDCHNPAQFCQSCHQQAGVVAARRIGAAGYHDAFRGFTLGHGQAARQSLESCASCHAERDCTACHSAVGGGFRFNPHGPGFNAARMRSKNPSLCIACHGTAIPTAR